MFQTKFVEKIKTHILCSVNFFENRAVYEMMSKNLVARRGVTNDVKIWRMRVECWISKTIHARIWTRPRSQAPTHTYARARTHTSIILIPFPRQKRFAKARLCYVILTLPVLFNTKHCEEKKCLARWQFNVNCKHRYLVGLNNISMGKAIEFNVLESSSYKISCMLLNVRFWSRYTHEKVSSWEHMKLTVYEVLEIFQRHFVI